MPAGGRNGLKEASADEPVSLARDAVSSALSVYVSAIEIFMP
jgi:hypothetical protein